MAIMGTPTTSSHSVVTEFEGTLLKNADLFSYFVLMAYEASGIIHSTTLLFLWPIITLLDLLSYKNAALKLMIFVATAGLGEPDIELVARAVLPKFYMDDISMNVWRVFSSCNKRVVVTRMPRIMVEWFAKEHLGADEVIGVELTVNRFGFVNGLVRESDIDQSALNRVADLFVDRRPHLGLEGRLQVSYRYEQIIAPVHWNHHDHQQLEVQPPKPVIFHDGRFVQRPTPATALLMLLWFPFGFILATVRIHLFLLLPFRVIPYIIRILGVRVTVKGKPPLPPVAKNSGVIFVANHRTILDAFILSYALGRKIPFVTYSALPQIWSPTPLVWISRTRDTDTEIIKRAMSKGDLAIFPEGTTCREPFLLRFSALFAELTDEIVPVAIKLNAGFYSACARGWNGLDLYSWFMNPTLDFEVTFLDQLPVEDTCLSRKTSYEVANHVQRILADTLGFKCTNLTRKDKYKLLT